MDSPRPQDGFRLTPQELDDLIERVFKPRPEEAEIAFLTDLPDARLADTQDWKDLRRLALEWARHLNQVSGQTGRRCLLFLYRHTGSNNADLPEEAWPVALQDAQVQELPSHADEIEGIESVDVESLYRRFPIIIAPTQFSATAPMKQAARRFGFRGATMPGFNSRMIPALKLDYTEVDRRCRKVKQVLDDAVRADFRFQVEGRGEASLTLDLRFRESTASGGLVPQPGTTGNLPSGETYIVPYEGERPGQPSQSQGQMPVQFGDEVVTFRIRRNRAVEVLSDGPVSSREAEKLQSEPAYGNIAELGVGVLGDFGVDPVGVILLDEKLAVHIAFGRSDHFGGQVAPSDFSSPGAVVHIDRVYHPKIQPKVRLESVDLYLASGGQVPLVRNDGLLFDFGQE